MMTDERLEGMVRHIHRNNCVGLCGHHADEMAEEIKRLRTDLSHTVNERDGARDALEARQDDFDEQMTKLTVLNARLVVERDELRAKLCLLTKDMPSPCYLFGVAQSEQIENDTEARSARDHARHQMFIDWLRRCATAEKGEW